MGVGFEFLEEIDEVGVVELEPFGDGGGAHAAMLGELFDDLALEVGVEDFTDANHGGIVALLPGGGAPNAARERVRFRLARSS